MDRKFIVKRGSRCWLEIDPKSHHRYFHGKVEATGRIGPSLSASKAAIDAKLDTINLFQEGYPNCAQQFQDLFKASGYIPGDGLWLSDIMGIISSIRQMIWNDNLLSAEVKESMQAELDETVIWIGDTFKLINNPYLEMAFDIIEKAGH